MWGAQKISGEHCPQISPWPRACTTTRVPCPGSDRSCQFTSRQPINVTCGNRRRPQPVREPRTASLRLIWRKGSAAAEVSRSLSLSRKIRAVLLRPWKTIVNALNLSWATFANHSSFTSAQSSKQSKVSATLSDAKCTAHFLSHFSENIVSQGVKTNFTLGEKFMTFCICPWLTFLCADTFSMFLDDIFVVCKMQTCCQP